MKDLNEWLEAWDSIPSEFDRWSGKCSGLTICFWPNGGDFHDLQLPGQSLRLGLIDSQRIGSMTWCLLHKGVARAAKLGVEGNSKLEARLVVAHRVCDAFKRLAERAGNLILHYPNRELAGVTEDDAPLGGLSVWVLRLFKQYDRGPDYQRFKPVRTSNPPSWVDALSWPFEIQDWGAFNPFGLSTQIALTFSIDARAIQINAAQTELHRLESHSRKDELSLAISQVHRSRQREIAQKPRQSRRAMTADEETVVMDWIRELVNDIGETEAFLRVELRTSEPEPHGLGRRITTSSLRRAWKRTNPGG